MTGVRLTVEDLMRGAEELTGLSDFGDTWFLRPLDALVEAINREAELSSLDVPPVHTLRQNLADRLRLIDYVKRHPQVRRERVEVVGVIIAHARGGSTLLQRLLTTSAHLTAPRWWEVITPVPLPDEAPGDHARRVAIADAWIAQVNEAAPEHEAIHPIQAMAYEEEVMLINRSFLSIMYSSYFNIPSYALWQQSQDHRKAYEELVLWLQLLQHQDPARRGRK